MQADIGCIAWHEDGIWDAVALFNTRDIDSIIDELEFQQTNEGAIALIAIEDEFFIILRILGDKLQIMISDLTYALEYELAADIVYMLDIEYPVEDDEPQPGGDLDLLKNLGFSEMELISIIETRDFYPEEKLEFIARKLGFGKKFNQVTGSI